MYCITYKTFFFLFFKVTSTSSNYGVNGAADTPISYFANPSYPNTDWIPNYSTFTIKVGIFYIEFNKKCCVENHQLFDFEYCFRSVILMFAR